MLTPGGRSVRKLVVTAILLLLASAGMASAQGLSLGALGFNEIRGGIYAHSWDQPGPNGEAQDFSRIQDLNAELLFTPLPTQDWLPGLLRPYVGASINFGGLESMAYAGLSWKLQVFSTPFFIEPGLGAAIHNGAFNNATYPARNLGCATLFHEQLSIGYDFSPNWDVTLTAEHASSASLCYPNRGLSNLGIRIGYKF